MSRASFIQLPPTLFFDAALPVALDPVPVDLADSPPAGGGPPAALYPAHPARLGKLQTSSQ